MSIKFFAMIKQLEIKYAWPTRPIESGIAFLVIFDHRFLLILAY